MRDVAPGGVGRGVAWWVDRVRRHAAWVTAAWAAAAAGCLYYSAVGLGVTTDFTEMISEDVPWRRDVREYRAAFPQLQDNVIVVIDGQTPDLASRAQRYLAARLEARPELFRDVYVPGGEPFFRRHGLLFRSRASLDSLARSLRRFGPWLRRLERRPTLTGYLAALDSALAEARRGETEMDLAPVLGLTGRAFQARAEGTGYQVAWQGLIQGSRVGGSDLRRLVTARPDLEYESFRPARHALSEVERAASEMPPELRRGTRVRVTGSLAMQDREIVTVIRGAALAGILALLAVGVILYLALRSVRLVVACLLTLAAGLAGTAAVAAATVGHLNLISAAFAVLYIGLGVDYAIHLSLRYRELIRAGVGHLHALRGAGRDVGPSLILSAVTTAAAFFAFLPTPFDGVAELGLISGLGMFVSLIATLTLLPALLTLAHLSPRRAVGAKGATGLPAWFAEATERRPRRVLVTAAVVGAASLALLPRARFDRNPLNLRRASTEAVATLEELMADTATAPRTVSLLTPFPDSARRAAARLSRLETVRRTVTLGDFVPADQRQKLAVLARVDSILGPPPSWYGDGGGPPGGAPAGAAVAPRPDERLERSPGERLSAVRQLRRSLFAYWPLAEGEAARRARFLELQIGRWLDRVRRWPPAERERFVERLEESLVGSLPGRLSALRTSLTAGRVTRSGLPDALRRRWVAPGGEHRVEVVPAGSLADTDALRRFVESVRSVAPGATGSPVEQVLSGHVVVRSFQTAIGAALLATCLVLAVTLRDLRDGLYVLVPLLLAGAVTGAASVVLEIPFNFANIIALPLLLGVGVDNGIHMVHRVRSVPPASGNLLTTSTARAVLFSFLTTIFSFGNLMVSPHPGTASMGRLLTIGMAAALVCTLIVLSALLHRELPGAEA